MKTKKNNSLINQKKSKLLFVILIFVALVFVLNANKIAEGYIDEQEPGDHEPYQADALKPSDSDSTSTTVDTETDYSPIADPDTQKELDASDAGLMVDDSSGTSTPDTSTPSGNGGGDDDDDDKEKCYCDACVGGCDPGCRKKAFYEDDCPCVDDCSECGGPSPEDEEEKCEYENPNPAEKKECTTKCKSSCQDMWHKGKSCTYRNWWEFWTLWKKHDGNYCCPDTCDDLDGYTCNEEEVCPEDWLSPLTGEKKCCSVPCVKPCGSYEDKTSSATGLSYITELDLDMETLTNDANKDIETDAVEKLINAGGVAACSDECPEFKYAVEGPAEESEWCKNCISPSGSHCCIYCPPKTVYVAGEGCKLTSCNSCENITGLPYNDPADESSYPDEGYSICKEECLDKDLGDNVVWKAYEMGEGDKWCSEINGGTDFENYKKCCAYCPPETHYSPINKSCDPDSKVSELTWKLNCPYIKLSWEKYEDAISYRIIPFYDEDKDKTADGICEQDIVNKEKSPFYYNLKSSSCVEHYTGNVRLQIIPQYSDGMSIKSYNTEWIDVSVCELKAKPED